MTAKYQAGEIKKERWAEQLQVKILVTKMKTGANYLKDDFKHDFFLGVKEKWHYKDMMKL